MTMDLHSWPLTSWSCKGSYIISINQGWFQLDLNFSNEVSPSYNLTSDDLWPWYMTFDCMNSHGVPYCINKPSLVPTGLQFFKWGHFHICSVSYNLTSDDLWPSYVTSDLINKWGLPCCIYDSTVVEIHQSMWKVEPNVNLFLQDNNNNRGQSDPYVSFLLRQATQTSALLIACLECVHFRFHQDLDSETLKLHYSPYSPLGQPTLHVTQPLNHIK